MKPLLMRGFRVGPIELAALMRGGQVLTVLISAQWTAMQAAAAGITISNAQIARELSSQRSLVRSAGIPLSILRATAENALLVAKLGPSDRAHPQALRALAAADRKNTLCHGRDLVRVSQRLSSRPELSVPD